MSKPQEKIAAFFDFDGTLVHANGVHYLVWLHESLLPRAQFVLWKAGFLLKALFYLVVDRIDRRLFDEVFYRNYRGLAVRDVRRCADEQFASLLIERLYPGARAAIAWHLSQGHEVVIVSGSADFLIEPLARKLRVEQVISARLDQAGGRFTGTLAQTPSHGRGKAQAVSAYAARNGVNLARSYAYGDSINDVEMLKCVGHPVVVNPQRKLRSIAKRRDWQVKRWALVR